MMWDIRYTNVALKFSAHSIFVYIINNISSPLLKLCPNVVEQKLLSFIGKF
jgi:hypothetical protein